MSTPTFTLTVNGIQLTLVEFDGTEEMNRLFKYTITTEIPSGQKLTDIINEDATFVIKQFDNSIYDQDVAINGYISQASSSNGHWILIFEPLLKKSHANKRSEIYYDENASLTPLSVIQQGYNSNQLLNGANAIFNITETLPTRSLFCQFHESNFNFVGRLCDQWGFHFYFDYFEGNFVVADNANYETEIQNTFLTTSATPDNALLKIRNWQEQLSTVNTYTTVIGHDYANAGTAINACYPSNGPSQADLAEISVILADVNSQDEADYLSRIRHKSQTCIMHKASGTTGIPYFFPGFVIKSDATGFDTMVVIKNTLQARNLNSANTAENAHFESNFVAIPDDTVFRPQPFYPVPKATNAIGKVICETNVFTEAQRNTSGEYKVELLGFDTSNAVAPWLRKAQTTAAGNNVDFPLLPETEVLISFIEDNPNCPYIQHALENSLKTVPVTNANPDHAVIETNGLLYTSSAEGRYNYSTTSSHSAQTDSGMGASVKNYFHGLGTFDQNTRFIDPSSVSTAQDFSHSEDTSGKYIMTRQYGDSVEIREGDRLHWHNGNLYDFGGYWNYNLGNSYEENYLDQASKINQRDEPFKNQAGADVTYVDLLKKGGPAFEVVEWIKIDGKVDLTKADKEYPFPEGDPSLTLSSTPTAAESKKPFFKDNVNTSKTFSANSYELSSECNAIEISDRCNSLEITHTTSSNKSTELVFHNGVLRSLDKTVGRENWTKSWNGSGEKTSETWSSNGDSEETSWHNKGDNNKSSWSKVTKSKNEIKTEEKTYNIEDGNIASESTTTTNGAKTSVTETSHVNTQTDKASFDFGRTNTFSLSAQGSSSLAISFSGSASVDIGFGLAFALKTGVEGGVDLDLRTGLELGMSSKGKLELSGIGFKAYAEARAEARKEALKLRRAEMELDSKLMKIEDKQVELETAVISIMSGMELRGL